ncbi:MAG: 3D domain-containing protein [Candidatus Pacebacteria bacterium]|nr:3D domain-containing protein [Candidatus Paceibacterota bacterium]
MENYTDKNSLEKKPGKYAYFMASVMMAILPVLNINFLQINQGAIMEKASQSLQPGSLAYVNENAVLPLSDPSAPEPKVARKINVIITAYSSSIWETDDSPLITAANTYVRDGIIAINSLPFGTKVRIPEIYGNKIFTVEDRMHIRKGKYHVDVWFPSYKEAKEFGAQRTYIEILGS